MGSIEDLGDVLFVAMTTLQYVLLHMTQLRVLRDWLYIQEEGHVG